MARKANYEEIVEDLNLVPIMNLVLCIIPLILFKTQLVKIGIINVNAPKIGPASSAPQPESDEKPLGLTVALSESGFQLKATGANVFEVLGMAQTGDDAAVKIDKKEQTYTDQFGKDKKILDFDYVDLYKKLAQIRDKYPEEKLLTVTADPTLEFKHVIRTMDSIRFRLLDDNVKDIKDLSDKTDSAKFRAGKETMYEPLWDQVTFAIAE